jgi:hypothetical protein
MPDIKTAIISDRTLPEQTQTGMRDPAFHIILAENYYFIT